MNLRGSIGRSEAEITLNSRCIHKLKYLNVVQAEGREGDSGTEYVCTHILLINL